MLLFAKYSNMLMTVMVFHHARYAQICLLILKHYSISEFIANATMEIEMSM